MGLDLSQTVTPPRAPGGANNDYDNDHDHDDSYLACIDAEPVKHLCQLASLVLKLIRLQLQ